MTDLNLIADTLDKAAEEIKRRGLNYGTLIGGYGGSKGCVCLLGGLGAAYFGDPAEGYSTNRRYGRVVQFLADEIGRTPGADAETAVFLWNDQKKPDGSYLHSKLAAVRLLRRAARKARAAS